MLTQLVAGAKDDAFARSELLPLDELIALARAAAPALDALEALAPDDTVKVIAEIKRASPSRGALADIPEPSMLAAQYELGGASAISVLTEGRSFGGSLDDLRAVRASVAVPVLRKDFVSVPYQVFEARAAGADIVLLIVAALSDDDLSTLYALVNELGMTALVETHSAEEVDRAVALGARLIGVNARNLSTFELDRELFGSLVDRMPTGTIKVAESAVRTAADVAHYRRAGADVVLVGEALVTGGDAVEALREFRSV